MKFRPLVVTALTLSVVACGGAKEPPRSPPIETAPATIEDAQAQIAAAASALGVGAAPKVSADVDVQPSAAAAPPSELSKGPTRVDACTTPCQALASMRRAVDALCRMTGDADARCVDARQTLADSVNRTSSCKCESR